MKMLKVWGICIAPMLTVLCLVPATAHATSQSYGEESLATFGDAILNLGESWGSATACLSDGFSINCYQSHTEVFERFQAITKRSPLMCTPHVALYDGLNYTGRLLLLTRQQRWINVAAYGFDKQTRSYQIGGCSALFAKAQNGGGGYYPGSTAGGASAGSMLSGWDKQVSSVYIQ